MKKTLSSESAGNNVEEFLTNIKAILQHAPSGLPRFEINLEFYKSDNPASVKLVEETLTDGSKVYNVEIEVG
jgi:hypothetical protein